MRVFTYLRLLYSKKKVKDFFYGDGNVSQIMQDILDSYNDNEIGHMEKMWDDRQIPRD